MDLRTIYQISNKFLLFISICIFLSSCNINNQPRLLYAFSLLQNGESLSIVYADSPYIFTVNSPITPKTPTIIGTVTSCSATPALPAGLSISNTTCTITGTPTATQSSTNYTITVTDSTLTTTTSISITVSANPPSALTYAGSPYTFTQNSAITAQTPTFSGTVTSCSASPALPTGLSINNTTCAITGTPTSTQAATSYTITATNAFGNTTASINITINPPPPSALTYTGSPYTFTQNSAITAQTPTFSGTVTSCSASPALPTGLSINNTTCAITGTPTGTQAATSYTITATNAFGNTTTSINITVAIVAPSALTYSSNLYVFKRNSAINTITPTFSGSVTSCSASPALPAGLSINNTTCAITGTPTANQVSTSYTITASNAGGNTTDTFSITVMTTVYKIFVTASTFNGDLKTAGSGGDGPAGADNLCNADANKPASGSYKAILYDSVNRTAIPTSNWVLFATSTYVRASDSAQIFITNASSIFTFGTLTNSFDSGPQKEYWTGFRGAGFEWQLGLYRCNEWTNSSIADEGRFGLSDATDYSSISQGTRHTCNNFKHLLCAEQ